jgi:hypothetical protein
MKTIFFFASLLFTGMADAQLLNVSPGTDLTIVGGTIFKTEGFTLTPAANFTISNNSLTRSATVIHSTLNPYISRVYQFTNNGNPYSGSVQINYTDGAELNGIPEGSLTLNVHNGTSWSAYPVATRDGINNFVLTNGLSGVNLNELTLGSLLTPLPVVWLYFTATNQNQTALLQWASAEELNTRNFTVQHSINGINWTGIGDLPAAGNSSSVSYYSFVHTTPLTGINYYRILQRDIDNRNSYSELRMLRFTAEDEFFTISGNPVTNGVLTVRINTRSVLSLYAADGKLMWQGQVNAGTTYIDVSMYVSGIYLLKTNFDTQKVMIE